MLPSNNDDRNNGIWQRFLEWVYSVGRFFKRHPILTAGLIGVLIAASILTGGLVLAIPAVIGGFVVTGAVVATILVAGAGIGATILLYPIAPVPLIGGSFLAFLTFTAVAASPVAGIVLFGIGLVSAAAALFAGIGACIFGRSSREASSSQDRANDPKELNPEAKPSDVNRNTATSNPLSFLQSTSTTTVSRSNDDAPPVKLINSTGSPPYTLFNPKLSASQNNSSEHETSFCKQAIIPGGIQLAYKAE